MQKGGPVVDKDLGERVNTMMTCQQHQHAINNAQ